MAKVAPALRKRQQITQANRVMFMWVAGASALVAVALVGSYFLFKQLVFNEKVLAEKRSTISTLEANNEAAPVLQDNVRVLSTNEALESAKANGDDSPLQAVLDGLPADGNSLAFGASLQQRLLNGISGLTTESVTVEPVAGVELTTEDMENTEDAALEGMESASQINFRFTVLGNDQALREALRRLERSIRPIAVTNVNTESAGNNLRMTVQGYTFYEPAKTVELKDKTVRP